MAEVIIEMMDMCKASGNTHLLWFRRFIDSHCEGIIARGTYQISTGKIEAIHNKIKILRGQELGYIDDEYFI